MIRIALSVLAFLLIAGCAIAPTPSVVMVVPIRENLPRYDALMVAVEAPEGIRSEPGFAVTSASLTKAFAEEAASKYASVGEQPKGDRILRAKLTVTQYTYVSDASRALIGMVAGSASLAVTMTLQDASTGETVGAVSAIEQGTLVGSSVDQGRRVAWALARSLK